VDNATAGIYSAAMVPCIGGSFARSPHDEAPLRAVVGGPQQVSSRLPRTSRLALGLTMASLIPIFTSAPAWSSLLAPKQLTGPHKLQQRSSRGGFNTVDSQSTFVEKYSPVNKAHLPQFVQTPFRTARYAARFSGNQKRQKNQKARADKVGEKKKKDNVIEMDGEVTMHSRNVFKVMLTNGAEVQCTLAGRLRMNSIKVLEGDKVTVELSPFDLTRGRITFRTIDRSLLETDKQKKEREKEEAKAARKQQSQEEVTR